MPRHASSPGSGRSAHVWENAEPILVCCSLTCVHECPICLSQRPPPPVRSPTALPGGRAPPLPCRARRTHHGLTLVFVTGAPGALLGDCLFTQGRGPRLQWGGLLCPLLHCARRAFPHTEGAPRKPGLNECFCLVTRPM